MIGGYRNKFRLVLPSELMAKAIPLTSVGVNEFAWKWRDAIAVVKILVANRLLVLGGDVYSYVTEVVKPTYDNWYFQPTESKSLDDALEESQNKSIEYIKAYAQKNGESFCYSIVIKG